MYIIIEKLVIISEIYHSI